MPAPKKVTKKAAAKHVSHEDPALKDRRRAHEHLGRVELLHRIVEKPVVKGIRALIELAHQLIEAGHVKDAADLLRAAEHLSFGSIDSSEDKGLDPELATEFAKEFQRKLERANDHWSAQDGPFNHLVVVFQHAKERAQKDFETGAYRKALELVRAAEALSHVKVHAGDGQEAGTEDGDEE